MRNKEAILDVLSTENCGFESSVAIALIYPANLSRSSTSSYWIRDNRSRLRRAKLSPRLVSIFFCIRLASLM